MRSAIFVLATVMCLAAAGEAALGQGKAGQETVRRKGGPATAALKQLTVVSTDAGKNTLTVRGGDGVEQELVLTGTTKIKKGRTAISLSEITAGESVTVYLKKAKDGRREPSVVKVIKPKKK